MLLSASMAQVFMTQKTLTLELESSKDVSKEVDHLTLSRYKQMLAADFAYHFVL